MDYTKLASKEAVTKTADASFQPLKTLADFIQYQRDKRHVIQTYERHFSRKLNWNHPTRRTEKINIFKISQEAEDLWPYVDKYEARKYIEKIVGAQYLIPIYGIYENVDDIPFGNLPKKFVLKTTHGSGWNIICRDKDKLDWDDAKKKLQLWMSQNYYELFGWERQYKKIVPRILCEHYVDLERPDMIECKVFCFNGKPRFINAIKDRLYKKKTANYSIEWKKLPFRVVEDNIPLTYPKPKNLDVILELATKLSAPFRYVRVDFYNIGGKLYVGELTFSSGGGMSKLIPDKYDEIIGSWLG